MKIHLSEQDKQLVIKHLENVIKQETNHQNEHGGSIDGWFSVDGKITCVDHPTQVVSEDPQVAALLNAIHILKGEGVPLKPEFMLPHENKS